MISRSCLNSRLHADAFCSSNDSCMSIDSRKTISGSHDGKKCAFECWLPDNCSQTAIKFRSTSGIGQTLSDMKRKRKLVRSSQYLMGLIKGDASICDVNGAEGGNLRSHAQSISQVMKSTGRGQSSIHTRFSVHSRSCNSRPWKDTSSRSSLPFASVAMARNMQKYLACQHARCETVKPAQRFSLFRTSSRQETAVRLRPPGVKVWHSSMPMDCSRHAASRAGLRFNLCSRDSNCNAIDTLPVYHKNAVNSRIQAAITHMSTETLQAGCAVDGEISIPKSAALLSEELHVMKTEHTNQEQRTADCQYENIQPSDIHENLSLVKLRLMAGKLIESLILKIKLQLGAGTHPMTGELDCENRAGNHVEHRHCNGTAAEQAAQGRCIRGYCRRLTEDISKSRHRRCQPTEKHLGRQQALKAIDEAKILVNEDDIHLSTNMTNDSTKDQRYGLQKIAAHARSDKAWRSLRTFYFETDLCSGDNQSVQENRGAHNDKSSLTNSITSASDYEDDDEEEEEMGSHKSTNPSDMKVERQTPGKRNHQLPKNDHAADAISHQSVLTQPMDPPSVSERSSSSSIRREPEPTSSVRSSSSIRKELEPKLEVVYNTWETKEPVGSDAVNKKYTSAATSSSSILSNMEETIDKTIEKATMNPETEATLRSFASEVVQSLYTAIRYKLKNLVQDSTDEPKKLEIMQQGDTELRNHILPTIIEHIIWIIKEEFHGQNEAKWKHAIMHDPGQYLDTIVTNAVMKTHAARMRQRQFLKTFVVTSNVEQSAKW